MLLYKGGKPTKQTNKWRDYDRTVGLVWGVLLTGDDGGADFAGGGGVAFVNAPPAVFAE